jgi:hypothetical protein
MDTGSLQTEIPHDQMWKILQDFDVDELTHNHTSLLVTPFMMTLADHLESSINHGKHYECLLQGPFGVGKTTTLLYLGHIARKKGYIVFPIQARNFVNQAMPMSSLIIHFLVDWIHVVGHDVLREILGEKDFKYILENIHESKDEKTINRVFAGIVHTLKASARPVVFLVDQCNVFNTNPQSIRLSCDGEMKEIPPTQNPVGCHFLNWDTFHMRCGGIFYAFASSFRLMPLGSIGNECLFSRMRPMNREEFQVYVDFLKKQNRLPNKEKCDVDDLFELCGGIAREANVFSDIFLSATRKIKETISFHKLKEQYMNNRMPLYKCRIKELMDERHVGLNDLVENVAFGARLFIGEKLMYPPNCWIASELLVSTTNGFALLCPAAKEALFSLFARYGAMDKVVEIFRKDRFYRRRIFELAIVSLFRRLDGRPIEFDCTNLSGRKKRTLKITAKKIQYAGIELPTKESVPCNTLVLYNTNIFDADVFIHDADGAQILIRTSELCYEKSYTKFDPNSYFIELYAAAAANPRKNAKLQCVFLTPDDGLMDKNSKDYCDDVMLVGGANMRRIFGNHF